MKSFLRSTAIYALALFLLPYFVTGVSITGGVKTLFIGGGFLTLMLFILRFLSLPLNILTLGLFSIISNSLVLYFLTYFVHGIAVKAFFFKGFAVFGFIIPGFFVNTLLAYLSASFVLSVIAGIETWLIE